MGTLRCSEIAGNSDLRGLLALSEWPYKTENARISGTGTEGSNLSFSAKESAHLEGSPGPVSGLLFDRP